jgi:hypothetical protein
MVGSALPTNKPFSMAMTVSSVEWRGYLAGRLNTTNTPRSSPIYTGTYTTIIGTTAGANTRVPNKTTNACGLWKSSLTPTHVEWLEREPYAFFEYVKRRVYYFPSSPPANNTNFLLMF